MQTVLGLKPVAISAEVPGSELLAGSSPEETMRRMWHRVAEQALWPNERLFFEIYA